MTTPELRIDRLRIRAGALSEADGTRLAELVAAALAEWPVESGSVAQLTVRIEPELPGRSVEQTAQAVLRAIRGAWTGAAF